MASDSNLLCFKVSSFSDNLWVRQSVKSFFEELVRSVLNKCRHLSLVGVGIHDYARVPFVCWENHDGLVLFQAFKCISHLLCDVRLW